MNSQTFELTDIAKLLLDKLAHHPTPQSLKNKHFLDQLQVLYLTKKPITHTFVCNTTISIQIQLKCYKDKPIQQYDLNPWNKVMTHYYQLTNDNQKCIYTFNCNDHTLFDKYRINCKQQDQNFSQNGMFAQEQCSSLESLDQDYQPNTYEPLHYIPRRFFDDFLKRRQNLFMSDPLDKIRITDWVLKVVNISGSVWYAFVIEVHKFQFMKEKVYADDPQLKSNKQNTIVLKNIGNIIYDKRFQPILQRMRLNHIRKDMENTTQQEEEISMCYHLKNVATSHKLPKMSQFVALDNKGEVIKYDSKRTVHFVPIGQLQGMCSFPQSVNLNDARKKEQIRQVSAFSMKGLHNILNKEAADLRRQKQMRQRLEYRVGKERSGQSNWNLLMKQKMENSLYRMHESEKGNLQSTKSGLDSDENELWDDSESQKEKPHNEMEEDEHYRTKYSDAINNEMRNESSSEEEEENEYFRKYREEMKKMFEGQQN